MLCCNKDLKQALNKSSAKWKIVVGHHAIRSAGHHGDTPELISLLSPMLKVINLFIIILYLVKQEEKKLLDNNLYFSIVS